MKKHRFSDIDPFDEDYVEISEDYTNDNIFNMRIRYNNITDYTKRQFVEKISKFAYYKKPNKIIINPLIFDIIKDETLLEQSIDNHFSSINNSNLIYVGKLVNIDLYLNKLLWDNKIIFKDINNNIIYRIEVNIV